MTRGSNLATAALVMGVAASVSAAPAVWTNSLKPAGREGPEIELAVNGATDYVIVVPAKATTQEQKAADDLAEWLGEMTGAEFEIVADSAEPVAHEICIGRTNRYSPPRSTRAPLGDEGYEIACQGRKLFLLGGEGRGVINAVYALLEEDLGLRWYAPDATRIPKRPTVRFRPVPRHFVPRLMIRDPFYKAAFDGTWSLRNRTSAPSAAVPAEWGGNITYAAFVHTVHALVPPGENFEKHPDWYMLTASDERNPHQLCMTNPEAIQAATEGALRLLRAQPDARVISVSKSDGGQTCQCEKCKALDEAEGSECASLLYMVNRVAEAVEKEFPKVTVSTLAYLETVKPPKTIRPRPNVAMRLCTDNCMWAHPFTAARQSPAFSPMMEGWSAVHNQIHIWDYVVNFSHYTAPMPNMEVIADNIRYFVDHHATGIMTQGAYQSVGAERDAMRSWVIAKLLWDPSRDLEALMRDFTFGYFGPAAKPIWEYNELLRRAGEEHADELASPAGGIRYGMDSPFLTDEFLQRATELYDEAEQLAGDSEFLARVERDRLPIMYVKLCRGPEFVGEGYGELIDRFEEIAGRVGLTHIAEGGEDVPAKIAAWREAAQGE